jgi:hypothetical protein
MRFSHATSLVSAESSLAASCNTLKRSVVFGAMLVGLATSLASAQNSIISATVTFRGIFTQNSPFPTPSTTTENQLGGIAVLSQQIGEFDEAELRAPNGPFASGISMNSDDGRVFVSGTISTPTRSGLTTIFQTGAYTFFVLPTDEPAIQTTVAHVSNPALWPTQAPSLSAQQWGALGEVDVTLPLTLSLPTFAAHPQATSGRKFVFIQPNEFNQLGDLEFVANIAPGASSVVVPANTLRPDVSYTLSILFQNVRNDFSQPATSKEVQFESRTQIPLSTVRANRCPADFGAAGGAAVADGILDNNDFIVFIQFFFEANPMADIGAQGGESARDGAFDNNDFIVFIQRFFAGC